MISETRRHVPGILLCCLLGALSIYLESLTTLPVMLLAIIAGLLLHRLNAIASLSTGINWCSRQLLYIGVALMGLRIDFTDLSQAGFTAPLLVIITLIVTLFAGFFFSRAFGQSRDFSILMSGSIAICGISAAAAICAALDE